MDTMRNVTFARKIITFAAAALLVTGLAVQAAPLTAQADEPNATQSGQLNAAQTDQITAQDLKAGSYDYYYKYAYYIQFEKNANDAKGEAFGQYAWLSEEVTLPQTAFKRAGYALAGWNTKKNGKGKSYKAGQTVKGLAKGGRDIKLYAQWKPANYIVYKGNGGKGKMAKQALPTGVATKLNANKFKRPGYVFTGWNTKQNGKGKSFKDTQSVKKLAKAGKTTTLYAQWTSKLKVSYNANGGTGAMKAQVLKVGKNTKLRAIKFKRSGYFFKNWNTKKNGKGTTYTNKQVVSAPLAGGLNTMLYAQWGKLPTSVTMPTNENTDSMSGYTYYTTDSSYSGSDDGKGTATIRFTYDGDEEAYKYVSFSFEDVTPPVYKKLYSDMGVKPFGPKVVSVKKAEPTDADRYYNVDLSHTAELTVEFGQSTRVFKVTADANGNKVTSGYVFCGSNGPADEELFWKVVHRVEDKLWTPGMSNRDKLYALAGYINSTCHYPGSAATTPENPTFWNNWSVEGKTLLEDHESGTLCVTMRFQGGICHCWAVKTLNTIAQHDLKLPYLYDSEKDEVAAGEGIWLGIGDASSTFTVGNHMSLIYKDANEDKYYIDAQGMLIYPGDDDVRCEDHGCLEHLISLK